jgi:crotonobetainyl-CoA:carnitine CoA-transferase CaiB-like acyl-CoA transferase
MASPLKGVRVLDLSRVLAGPLASMILGDLGADVIKVERAESGDETRGWGPPFDERGQSAYFLCCNRNKLSVAVDLDRPTDQALLRTLVEGADVVIDNFRPGVLAKRGLDPLALLERHPRLLWCTISGFGLSNERPGYDFVVQAESGWMSITGEPMGDPMKVGVALADALAGRDSAIAILAMLAGGRRGSASERRLHVSLQHSAVSALINVAQNALVTGAEATRWGNAHPNLVPYELFDTADKPVVIAVGSDAQFAALVEALDIPMLRDAKYATNTARLALREEVTGAIRLRLITADSAEWLRRLQAAQVPCGVVRTVLEALQDVSASELTGVAPLAPGSVRRVPPTLDQHGTLIRASGWDGVARA